MGQLTNQYVSSSYQGLIKLEDSTQGLTGTLQPLTDGLDNPLPILVSATDIIITGSFAGDGTNLTGITFDTSSIQSQIDSKLDSSSFESYTSSNDDKVNSLINATGSYLTELPDGLVSGSSQIVYSGITGIPSGIVSSSSQIQYSGLTGIPSGIVSGSEQISFNGITDIPTGLVSGSEQISDLGYATTGSNTFIGDQIIQGELTATAIKPNESGSIWVLPNNSITYPDPNPNATYITGPDDVNIIFSDGSVVATGSLEISGSNNLSLIGTSPAPAGRKAIMYGKRNIYLNYPIINNDALTKPNITSNNISTTVNITGSTTSAAPLSIINNNVQGALNLNHSSFNGTSFSITNNFIGSTVNSNISGSLIGGMGSITNNYIGATTTLRSIQGPIRYQNNLSNGTVVVNNNYLNTGSNNFLQVGNNIIAGRATPLTIEAGGSPSTNIGRYVEGNIVGGENNYIYVNAVDTNSSGMYDTFIYGNSLNVVGSSAHNTLDRGSVFLGRYNDDVLNNDTSTTILAIGTGTSISDRKTGFWIKSDSTVGINGNTSITGSLSVDGVLSSTQSIDGTFTGDGTGLSITLPDGLVSGSSQISDLGFVSSSETSSMTVASASYAVTASYVLNGGGGPIDTGSFATTGSNVFSGNQTITGSIFIEHIGEHHFVELNSTNLNFYNTSETPGSTKRLIFTGDNYRETFVVQESGDLDTRNSKGLIVGNPYNDSDNTCPGNWIYISGSSGVQDNPTGSGNFMGFGADKNSFALGNYVFKNSDTSQTRMYVSGSVTAASFIGDGSQLTNLPTSSLPDGLVSSSAQISYTGITDTPSNLVSSSVQIDITQTTGYSTFSSSVSKDNIYQLYQPDKTNPFVYTDNSGALHIDGNIIQNGSAYETHAEKIYSTKDYIYLRSGSVGGLGVGEYTGIEAEKYDGLSNGRLVFDNQGWAKVGDVGSEQTLATRIDSPTNNYMAIWDDANKRLDFVQQYQLPAGVVSGSAQVNVAQTTGYSTLATTGSNTFVGTQVVSGSNEGNVNAITISSNTGSMDCGAANFFTITLPSAATHILPTNINRGQTISVLVTTTGGNTVTFPSSVKQQSGASYTPTNATGKDILTFVAFDTTTIYLTNIKNLL